MTKHTFFRRADVPKAKAVRELLRRHPGAEVVGEVRTKRATRSEARFASVREGERIYEATIKFADDEGGDEGADLDLTKKDDAPPAADHDEPDADDAGGPPDDDADDKGGEEKGGDKPFGGGKEKGGEAPKLDVKDRIADALDRIADALSGGGLPGGPPKPHDLGPGGPPPGPGGPGGPGGGPDALPDIGAPGQGEALPPPVPPKHGPAGPAFASVKQRVAAAGTAVLVKRDVDDTIGTKEIIAEANAEFPNHKVAQVRRNGIAEIKGVQVDLPAHKIALVTLVRK